MPGDPHKPMVFDGSDFTEAALKRILDLAEHTANSFVNLTFLRAPYPRNSRSKPPLGLLVDHQAHHFDPSCPSDLETLLASHDLDNTHDLNRARDAIARIKAGKLGEDPYCDPQAQIPPAGYILVLDQPRNDPSVLASHGNGALFAEMLYYAQENHPGQKIVIKTVQNAKGENIGFFNDQSITRSVISLYEQNAPDWDLLEHAGAVYTVSSNLGFLAILAGHKPFVFGKPFYAGWGLTHDSFPITRRKRSLTRAQLFLGAMIYYPKWYDPCRDRLCDLETILNQLEAAQRAYFMDRTGWNAHNIMLWKRPALRRFFGGYGRVNFGSSNNSHARSMVWGHNGPPEFRNITFIEDGFIRSWGLGADLVPPLSLVCDMSGMYFDPTRPSDLETLLAQSPDLRMDQRKRARQLITTITAGGISKYNLGGDPINVPSGHRILVPGQVEDDASIRQGSPDIRRNLDLLQRVRDNNPNAVIIYKPHPDVTAGLRQGAITAKDLENLVDVVAPKAPISDLLTDIDAVHTMTSLTGFEALLRNKSVTTYGQPFYAGWGLTTDLASVVDRRGRILDLETLVHRVLIDYPRYFDPQDQMPCAIETVLYRLEHNQIPQPALVNRILARLQRRLAPFAPFWR